jgi:demethoxyubiquinone hydroxylase (CLK1/Coq7/Cat5 family)
MRRKLAAMVVTGLLAVGVVASSLTPAEATHTLAHLRRQINRLENQVSTLNNQVRVLRDEVFNCERIADYQVTDPTTAQPVTDTFVVYVC